MKDQNQASVRGARKMRKPKSPAAFDDNKVQIQTTLDKWPYEDDVEGEPRDQKTERD